jgi:hypothetical protein
MATKKTPVAKTSQVEVKPQNDSMSIEDEKAAMQEQFKFQLKSLLKGAAAMGMSMEDIYEKPPVNITVVYDQTSQTAKIQQPGDRVPLDALGQPVAQAPAQLRPGQVIPGTQNWRPWNRNDLDPENMVSFVPMPVPGLVFPLIDDEGRQKIKLDVNDLVCWLTCGIENRVNMFFYQAYKNSYDQWRELEYFKRHGPSYAPWGTSGEDGQGAWKYIPVAASFGMTADGRSLRVGPPTVLDVLPGEEIALPPGLTSEGEK